MGHNFGFPGYKFWQVHCSDKLYLDLGILHKCMLAKQRISGFPNHQRCQPKAKRSQISPSSFYHHKIKPISFTCRKEMCAFILFPFLLIGQKGSQHLRRRNGEACTFLLNPGKQTSRYFLLAQSGPSFSIFGHTQVRPGYFLSWCRCYKGMACFPVLPALQRWQVRSVLLNFISVFD